VEDLPVPNLVSARFELFESPIMANLAQCSIGNRHTRRRKLVKTARKDAFLRVFSKMRI
jgi:hypothetical protein